MADTSDSERPGNKNQPSEKYADRERYAGLRDGVNRPNDSSSVDIGTMEENQVFSLGEIDPVLDKKMRLVNKV